MSEFQVAIPYRDRAETLDADAISDLPMAQGGEERAVVRSILVNARLNGAETVGDMLDRLDAAAPAERRRIVDRARAKNGLTTFAEIEHNHRRAEIRRWSRSRSGFESTPKPGRR
jgi:hypothetical protein